MMRPQQLQKLKVFNAAEIVHGNSGSSVPDSLEGKEGVQLHIQPLEGCCFVFLTALAAQALQRLLEIAEQTAVAASDSCEPRLNIQSAGDCGNVIIGVTEVQVVFLCETEKCS